MSNFTNRKWVIIPSCFVTSVNFSKVLQTSKDTLRYSLDNTKTFIKYDSVRQPNFLSSITCFCIDCGCSEDMWCMQGITEYNHSEILTILQTNEWSDYSNI